MNLKKGQDVTLELALEAQQNIYEYLFIIYEYHAVFQMPILWCHAVSL